MLSPLIDPRRSPVAPLTIIGYIAIRLAARKHHQEGCAISLSILSLLETRVLGVLIETERTVPDSYPLTLNALISGCNQKTFFFNDTATTETEAQAAIDSLKSMMLVIESSGGRVSRYTHN